MVASDVLFSMLGHAAVATYPCRDFPFAVNGKGILAGLREKLPSYGANGNSAGLTAGSPPRRLLH
ncbi:hypothetical protein GCM10007160_41180 [Litchfieldella qijiaojingensis]|uniref:Uncharacterized protein n=1 Tax=Litchfieldella qijiaojingensis TaxID=980347 RepID=A0ABQ2ZBA8_9GAMM|nr:hypothetical protein GCM10007160_41180 [Halomonas qijiaojingensis]